MTERPEEERRAEQAAQAPEQQAAKQAAEQQHHAEAARLHQEAVEELTHLERGNRPSAPRGSGGGDQHQGGWAGFDRRGYVPASGAEGDRLPLTTAA